MRYLFLVLLVACGHAFGEDASHCISINSNQASQTFTNRCAQKVIVIWCHDSEDKAMQSTKCGGDKFYRQNHVLEPMESFGNSYSLPLFSNVRFGACFGGYGYYSISDMSGGYTCKIAPKSGESKYSVIQGGGRDRAVVCEQLKKLRQQCGTRYQNLVSVIHGVNIKFAPLKLSRLSKTQRPRSS